jgi:hypothetical protein
MFEIHLPEIEQALQRCTLVELDQKMVSVVT